MIKYFYIYLINKMFWLETKKINVFSVLEDQLSTKCIVFLFLFKFRCKQKNPARHKDRDWDYFVLIQARDINKFQTGN